MSCSDARERSSNDDHTNHDSGPTIDAGLADAGEVEDAGAPDALAPPDAGPPAPPPQCAPTQVNSACGTPAIVRALARLPDGSEPASGILQVRLHHYRLGNGEFGGIPHIAASGPSGTEMTAATWNQVDFDMCAGGEMWSEDNCEYNLYAFLDLNEDGELNRGEPAARKTIDVSCFADPLPCHDLVLDCLDGASCIAFDAEPVCACKTPSCPEQIGKIVTCQ